MHHYLLVSLFLACTLPAYATQSEAEEEKEGIEKPTIHSTTEMKTGEPTQDKGKKQVPQPNQKEKKKKNVHVLTIDSGGVHGLIPARILQHIEKELSETFEGRVRIEDGKRIEDPIRISDCFDIIVATSSGTICALGLTSPLYTGWHPTNKEKDIAKFYEERSQEVFYPSRLPKILRNLKTLFWESRYSDTASYEKILYGYFGDMTLKSIVSLRVLIPVYNMDTNHIFIFDSEEAKTSDALDFKLKDVALAATAAPVYFNPVTIESENHSIHHLMDGAVFANNPTLLGFQKAQEFHPTARTIFLVSLGTGYTTPSTLYEDLKKGGWPWADHLFPIINRSTNQFYNYMMSQEENSFKRRGGRFHYFRVNPSLPAGYSSGIDDVREITIQNLKSVAANCINPQTDEGKRTVEIIEYLKKHFRKEGYRYKEGKAPPQKTAYILCIDGGGVRGIMPATILKKIEEKLTRKLGKNISLAECFDLIAGTSTGGIIGLSLCTEDPNDKDGRHFKPEKLAEFYTKHGKDIFPPGFLRRIKGYLMMKYSAAPLEALLQENFEDKWLSQAAPHVRIAALDAHTDDPYWFDSEKAKYDESEDYMMRDVARATSAAPTYFPTAQIKNKKGENRAFRDGGLFANNPTFDTAMTAPKIYPDLDLKIVSLGTAEAPKAFGNKKFGDAGKAFVAEDVVAIQMNRNDQITIQLDQLQQILKMQGRRLKYRRIQPIVSRNLVDDLDNANNIEQLERVGRYVSSKSYAGYKDIKKIVKWAEKAYKEKHPYETFPKAKPKNIAGNVNKANSLGGKRSVVTSSTLYPVSSFSHGVEKEETELTTSDSQERMSDAYEEESWKRMLSIGIPVSCMGAMAGAKLYHYYQWGAKTQPEYTRGRAPVFPTYLSSNFQLNKFSSSNKFGIFLKNPSWIRKFFK